LGTSFSSPV